jgi:hypothetical protein
VAEAEVKQFFFEKKNQKTFTLCSTPDGSRPGATGLGRADKSFLFLFFQKGILPSFLKQPP